MTESNPASPRVPGSNEGQPGLARQLDLIRQLSEMQHDALMSALESFRAEMRVEFALLRARMVGKSL
jgi:hypothetical protein